MHPYDRKPGKGETLVQCAECRLPYPSELLGSLTGDGDVKGDVCGCCALDLIRKIHGTSVIRLRGRAEELRQDALVWRKANKL